ncbi:MAG: hypothetical protein Q9M89_02810 [Persephonella sp.]|nr:hypothetical protein [Persephonella sp.]
MSENGNGKEINVVLETMTNALTDQMVERLTQNVEKLIELGDKLSDPQMMEAIDKLTKNAEALNKSVENLIETTTALSTMLNAFTDSMVERANPQQSQNLRTC